MLTKSDLTQIKDVVENVVDERLEAELEPVKKDLKYLKKKINRIDKTVSVIVKNYDEGDVKLDRRVTRIEKHLNLQI